MNRIGSRIAQLWQAETGLLGSVLIVASLLLIFGLIADEVLAGSTAGFDRSLMMVFRNSTDPSILLGPAWVPEMVRDITALGSFAVLGIVLFAIVGYLVLANMRAAASLMLAAVLGGAALNSLLKFNFARPRPDFIVPAAKVFTASFPSGHAVLSAITYLTIAALLARTTVSRPLRIYFVTVGIALTLLVGVSRVYLGVHYPSDILAGWCVGSAWALGCWAVMSRLQHGGKIEPPRSANASH
jgi:undecaprenyl-diphosphatase